MRYAKDATKCDHPTALDGVSALFARPRVPILQCMVPEWSWSVLDVPDAGTRYQALHGGLSRSMQQQGGAHIVYDTTILHRLSVSRVQQGQVCLVVSAC
jgi:hypothetical protein